MRALLFVLALAPSLATAQVVLDLPDASPLSGETNLTVARVLDLRADTSTVGEAKVGLFNRRRSVEIGGGTVPALTAYFQRLLPDAPGRRPVVVGIDVLHVSEQTTAVAEFGRAEVQLRVFEETGGGLAELGGGQSLVEASALDVTRGHTDRLARALNEAVLAFLSGAPPDPDGTGPVLAEAALVGAAEEDPGALAAPLTEAAEQSIRSFVTGGPMVGANGTGGRLAYGIRPAGNPTWLVPVTLEATVLQTGNDDRGLDGVFSTYGGTVQVGRRLGQTSTYLQGGLQITGGSESLPSGDQFFFGGRLGAEVVRYPVDRGAVLGLGVYGSRLFGSALYPRDAGATATLGYQF